MSETRLVASETRWIAGFDYDAGCNTHEVWRTFADGRRVLVWGGLNPRLAEAASHMVTDWTDAQCDEFVESDTVDAELARCQRAGVRS